MVVDPRPASAILEAGHEKLVTLLNRPSLAEAFQQAKSFMNPPTFYSCFSACATDNSGSRQGEHAWQMSDLRHLHLSLETRRPGTERGISCERGSMKALSPCIPAQNCLRSWSSQAQSTASTWERAAAVAGTRPGACFGCPGF